MAMAFVCRKCWKGGEELTTGAPGKQCAVCGAKRPEGLPFVGPGSSWGHWVYDGALEAHRQAPEVLFLEEAMPEGASVASELHVAHTGWTGASVVLHRYVAAGTIWLEGSVDTVRRGLAFLEKFKDGPHLWVRQGTEPQPGRHVLRLRTVCAPELVDEAMSPLRVEVRCSLERVPERMVPRRYGSGIGGAVLPGELARFDLPVPRVYVMGEPNDPEVMARKVRAGDDASMAGAPIADFKHMPEPSGLAMRQVRLQGPGDRWLGVWMRPDGRWCLKTWDLVGGPGGGTLEEGRGGGIRDEDPIVAGALASLWAALGGVPSGNGRDQVQPSDGPEVWPLVIAHLRGHWATYTPDRATAEILAGTMAERHRQGVEKYKMALRPGNGLDAAKETLQEGMDACAYSKQLCLENPEDPEAAELHELALALAVKTEGYMLRRAQRRLRAALTAEMGPAMAGAALVDDPGFDPARTARYAQAVLRPDLYGTVAVGVDLAAGPDRLGVALVSAGQEGRIEVVDGQEMVTPVLPDLVYGRDVEGAFQFAGAAVRELEVVMLGPPPLGGDGPPDATLHRICGELGVPAALLEGDPNRATAEASTRAFTESTLGYDWDARPGTEPPPAKDTPEEDGTG